MTQLLRSFVETTVAATRRVSQWRDRRGRTAYWYADIGIFAAVILVFTIKAALEFDVTWDTLAYHLPFAARRAGLMTVEEFTLQSWTEGYYLSFPVLPYYIYGYLWRFSGSANLPNVVSVVAFALYCGLIARSFRAPLSVVVVAIAAIPAIHVNLSSVYTDLVANLAFAAAMVLATKICMEPQGPLLPRVLWILALCVIPPNYKIHFIPLTVLFFAGFAAALVVARLDGRRLLSLLGAEARQRPGLAVACVALVLLSGATAVNNLIVLGNPIHPIGLTAFGVQILPGSEVGGLYPDPQYLNDDPQYVRWLLSVAEYAAFGTRAVPYTLGQGNVVTEADSLRMGGYLGLFVLYNLFILGYAAVTGGPRLRKLAAVFAVITIVVACLPASHELRYYSFWMVYLVSMSIACCWRWSFIVADRRHYAAVAVAAFVFVGFITGWNYVLIRVRYQIERVPSLEHLRAGVVPATYRAGLKDGGRYCLLNWGPYALLAAPMFYRDVRFTVMETYGDGSTCPPDTVAMDMPQLQAAARGK